MQLQIWHLAYCPKYKEVLFWSWSICEKYHCCVSKGNGVILWKLLSFKSEFDLDLWPVDPKMNRDPPCVMVNSCVKYHYCRSKGNGVIVQIWLWPFDPKIKRGLHLITLYFIHILSMDLRMVKVILGVCGKRVSARYPHYFLTYNDDTSHLSCPWHEVNPLKVKVKLGLWFFWPFPHDNSTIFQHTVICYLWPEET